MPNYEYQCTQCNHRFEIWQNVGEPAPECPDCASAVRKIFHPPRVIFKGSGFYITDTRAEQASAAQAGKAKNGSSEGGGTGSGSSESGKSESSKGDGGTVASGSTSSSASSANGSGKAESAAAKKD